MITGDISNAQRLPMHLGELAGVCAEQTIYFVAGNHDYYGSSLEEVDRSIERVCGRFPNLRHLGRGNAIPLGSDLALVGHQGWPDGRAGWGCRTVTRSRDHRWIADFRGMSRQAGFAKMEELGRCSGQYFRDVLPHAMQCYRHVLIATHVPPFVQAVRFGGEQATWAKLPHYANTFAGGAIAGIAAHYPRSRVTVLCGHTHSRVSVDVTPMLTVRCGHARTGFPAIEEVLEIN